MNHLKNRLRSARYAILNIESLKFTLEGLLNFLNENYFRIYYANSLKIKNTCVNESRLYAVKKTLENVKNLEYELIELIRNNFLREENKND